VKLEFLGDALDYWKGSLFESLRQSSVLHDFRVDAMASDWPAWQQEDVTLYARLLRIGESKLIRHNESLASREQYFGEIEHMGDLFLDPDTGIATGRVEDIGRYVKPLEIDRLLRGSERVLAIYQHVRAQRVSQRVDEVCSTVKREVGERHWCSYESPTVALIFLSRCPGRPLEIATHFRKLLGKRADKRIRTSASLS
jgi:hypothetical protein